MVAERISDFALQRDPLPAAKFDVGKEPWQPPSTKTNKEKVAINV
jgi:hypothetical protein